MKRIILLAVLVALGVFTSCQNKQKAPKVKEATPKVAAIVEVAPKIKDVDASFKAQITDIFTAYSGLKDALVTSDSVTSITAAKATLTALDKGDMGLLKKSESHKVWMGQKPILKQNLNKLISEVSLETQRLTFLDISNSMIKLVENFGINQKVMVQFCPMADDFKGGFWLSLDAKIKNPYYGSKMLTCGSTKRIIK